MHNQRYFDEKSVVIRMKKMKFTPKSINKFFKIKSFKYYPYFQNGFPFQNTLEEIFSENFVRDIRAYLKGI